MEGLSIFKESCQSERKSFGCKAGNRKEALLRIQVVIVSVSKERKNEYILHILISPL